MSEIRMDRIDRMRSLYLKFYVLGKSSKVLPQDAKQFSIPLSKSPTFFQPIFPAKKFKNENNFGEKIKSQFLLPLHDTSNKKIFHVRKNTF